MKPVNLDQALLGPRFETHSPQSFRDYVESLKQIKAIDKPARPPRIKREPVFHTAAEGSSTGKMKLCSACGKKYRSEKAKCPGAPGVSTDQTAPVETLDETNPVDFLPASAEPELA